MTSRPIDRWTHKVVLQATSGSLFAALQAGLTDALAMLPPDQGRALSPAAVDDLLAPHGLDSGDLALLCHDLGERELLDALQERALVRRGLLDDLCARLTPATFGPFRPTITAEIERLAVANKIGAVPDTALFGEFLTALEATGPNAVSRALAGKDLSDPIARTEAADAIRALFRTFAAGDLDPAEAGRMTPLEFLRVLEHVGGVLHNPAIAFAPPAAA